MKKITFLFIISCMQAGAQTYKGKWLFENTFGNVYSNSAQWKQEYQGRIYTFDDKYFGIDAGLNFAYFLNKNFAFGLGCSFNHEQTTSNGYSESGNKVWESNFKDLRLLATPFLRYYVHPTSKSSLYIQAGGGGGAYLYYTGESTEYNESGTLYTKYKHNFSDHKILTAEGRIGLNYFFNEFIALNTYAGYTYTTLEYLDNVNNNYPIVPNTTTQVFSFSSKQKIISWGLGFTIFLGKKKTDKELKKLS